MILPLPVKKNEFGQRVANLPVDIYYCQIAGKLLEAHNAAIVFKNGFSDADFANIYEAEELVDVIATCITRLEHLGYDESARQKLYQAVNDKNKNRGYFDD